MGVPHPYTEREAVGGGQQEHTCRRGTTRLQPGESEGGGSGDEVSGGEEVGQAPSKRSMSQRWLQTA